MLSSDSSHSVNGYLPQELRAFWMLRHLLHLPPVLEEMARWTAPSRLALLLDLVKVPTKILKPYLDVTNELGEYGSVIRMCESRGYTVTLIGRDLEDLFARLYNPLEQWNQHDGFKRLHIWSLVRRAAAWIKKGDGSERMMQYDTVLHDEDGNVMDRPQYVDRPRYRSRHTVVESCVVVHEHYLTWDTWQTSGTSVGAFVSAATCPVGASRFFQPRRDLSHSSTVTPCEWFVDINAMDHRLRAMDVVDWSMDPERYEIVPAVANESGTILVHPADRRVVIEPRRGRYCFVMPLQSTPVNDVDCRSLYTTVETPVRAEDHRGLS